MPLDGGCRVGGMDKALAVNREVKQKGAVVAHAAVVQVGQLVHALDLVVLALVVEPSGADAGVALAGTPRVAVGMTRLQFLVLRVAGIYLLDAQECPVRRFGKAFLVAHPATAGTTVREDDGIRLQAVHDAPGFGVVVVGAAVDLTFLARTAIPAVAAVGTIEPHLKNVAILRHQFLQLVVVIGDILLCAIAGLMTVPWREVHAEAYAVFAAGVRQFTHDIALEGRVGDVVVGVARVPQAEAVMVLAGEDDALHARLDNRLHPLFAVESGRVESAGWSVTIAPFLVQKGVGPEVDKCIGLQALPRHLLRRRNGSTRLGSQTVVSYRGDGEQQCH